MFLVVGVCLILGWIYTYTILSLRGVAQPRRSNLQFDEEIASPFGLAMTKW